MILVTRPFKQSLRTQEELEFRGYNCLVYPLMDIRPKQNWVAEIKDGYDGIIITSQNAAEIVKSHPLLRAVSLYVVGGESSKILLEGNIKFVAEDSSELAKYLKKQNLQKLLFLSGDYVSTDFIKCAKEVKRVVVYESVAINKLPLEMMEFVRHVLFYSPRSAEIFRTLITNYNLKKITAICMSKKVAKAIADLDWAEVKIAKKPNESSLLSFLPLS